MKELSDISIEGILNRKGAVNAAIEAAWAGDTSRGLSVMAAELKKLSELAKKADAELTTQFESCQNDEGGQKKLTTAFYAVAALAQEIRAASNELKSGLEKIKTAYIRNEYVKQRVSKLIDADAAK